MLANVNHKLFLLTGVCSFTENDLLKGNTAFAGYIQIAQMQKYGPKLKRNIFLDKSPFSIS